MDIALVFDPQALTADIVVENGGLRMDAGLTTAVLVSLFTDRRAEPDDPLDPLSPTGDRRGWAGDLLQPAGDRYGSRLWLLQRAKMTDDTALLAQQYALESLQWAVDQGIATSVDVQAERVGLETLSLTVAMKRGTKPLGRWSFVWSAQAEAS